MCIRDRKKHEPLGLLQCASQDAPSGLPKVLHLSTVKEMGLAYCFTKNPAQSPSIRRLSTAKSVKGERMTANVMLSRIQLLLTPYKRFRPLGVSGVDAWRGTELGHSNAAGVGPDDRQARRSLTVMKDRTNRLGSTCGGQISTDAELGRPDHALTHA
eukprot:2444779-Pyramimonas_sp.AAC.1